MFAMQSAIHFMTSIRTPNRAIKCAFFEGVSHFVMTHSWPNEYENFSLGWPAITNSSDVIGLLVNDERERGDLKVLFAISNLDSEKPCVEFMNQDGKLVLQDLSEALLSELVTKFQLPDALRSEIFQKCKYSDCTSVLSC